MSTIKVDVDHFADAIMNELKNYKQEVTDGTKSDIRTVSKELTQELKQTSPREEKSKRRGRYARGWRDTEVFEDAFNIRVVVHNKTDYQLAHLLEFGHEVVVRGGRVVGHYEGKPHIRPAEQRAEEKLMKKVKVRVKG